MVRLGYGNADSLGRWWIDQYLDLAPEQDALVRERLVRLHAWHRKTQLPDYARLLRDAKGLAIGRMTPDDGLQLTESIIRRVRTLAEQALPDAADLLLTLGPAQIERMAQRLADRNVDWAKDARLAEGEAAQRTARVKRLLERAEYWYGDFSDEQQATIRRLVEAQPTGAQFWYEERLRRQREWLDLARKVQAERPPRERVIALLRDYVARFDLPSDPARRATALAHRRAGAELAAAIQALTTPAQREHAWHKFDDLTREIGELAQEG
jgi:hypothetical protein